MRSWGVKGLIFQVSRDSCPYNQWEFDCQKQQVKKILHQAMNKKLKELLNKNPEYTGFQHLTKQTLLIECHAHHTLHIVWQDIFPSIMATKGLEYTGPSVVNLHKSSPVSDKQYTDLSCEPKKKQCEILEPYLTSWYKVGEQNTEACVSNSQSLLPWKSKQ